MSAEQPKAAASTVELEKFLAEIEKTAPDIRRSELERLIAPELISGYVLELPRDVLEKAQSIVRAFFSLRKDPTYLEALTPEMKSLGIEDPGHYSIAMSYDFHVDSTGELKLVEINTNAAFLALAPVMYRALGISLPIADFSHDEIRQDIENEMRLAKIPGPPVVSIIDENPQSQRLYVEFLLYQSLLRQWGWSCEIEDVTLVSPTANFVYNRSTDFYLQNESSKRLRGLLLSGKVCISPNPFEYFCLADKKRLIELSEKQNLSSAIERTLLRSSELTPSNAENIWNLRKKYFFKPLRAFGGKQSYRGENISHRLFDELVGKGIIAQEFCPPAEVEHQGQKFKYDLRFFAYMDRIQCAVTRLYQGQVTNLKTVGGGFGTVKFV